MKFSYQYKTSDGERHAGVYVASTREAVYEELRRKGVKPFCVEPLPGFFNALSGVSKRAVAIVILAVVVVSLLALLTVRDGATEGDSITESETRRQIVGDSAVIEMGMSTGWRDVFAEEGERFLASFAVPGVPAAVRSTSGDELTKSLTRRIEPRPEDSLEAKQIKSIVEGMKKEIRAYLAQGGTVQGYGERLVDRQDREIEYYAAAKRAVADSLARRESPEEVLRVWKERNEELRRMGIKLVPFPRDEES